MRTLKQNITKHYIFTFLSSFNVTSGVWMLYLAFKGLSLFEIGMMEAIFHITSFTMEVPTGIVADVLGRKTSRYLGRAVSVVSTVIMLLATGVVGFAVSFILSALSYNLESGAGDALLYDSMKEIGEAKGYMKVKGRGEFFFQLANALALPIGGYLATIDYKYVYVVALFVGVMALIQSLTFKEPTIGKVEQKENHWATFTHQLKDSIQIIKTSRSLSFFILLSASFGVFATTTFFYIQNFLKLEGRSEFRIGIVLSIGALFAAIGATYAHRIEKKFGLKRTLSVLLIAGSVCVWMMVTGTFSEVGIILLSLFESIEYVVMSDYINQLIPSERRATILSMESMTFSLFMIIIFPIVGLVGDSFGLSVAFAGIAALSSLVTVLVVRKIHKASD